MKQKNPGAFKSQKNKDRRVTLNSEGRIEHTRLFHQRSTGKVAKSKVWKANSLWNPS